MPGAISLVSVRRCTNRRPNTVDHENRRRPVPQAFGAHHAAPDDVYRTVVRVDDDDEFINRLWRSVLPSRCSSAMPISGREHSVHDAAMHSDQPSSSLTGQRPALHVGALRHGGRPACRADTSGLNLGLIGRLRLHIVAPDPDPGPIPERRSAHSRPLQGGRPRQHSVCTVQAGREDRGWAPDRGPGRRWVWPRNRFRSVTAGMKRSGMAPDRKSRATVGPLSGYCAAAAGRAASELEVA